MKSEQLAFICLIAIVGVVMYQYSSSHPEIIEGWWGNSVPLGANVQSTVGYMHKQPNGQQTYVPLTNTSGNNVSQLNVTQTQPINTSMLTTKQQEQLVGLGQTLSEQLSAQQAAQAQAVSDDIARPRRHHKTKENFKGGDETRSGPKGFFTVPGYTQNMPPPRFSNTGYSGNITYNLPEVNYLASNPHDPLSRNHSDRAAQMANIVENFQQKGAASSSKELSDFGFQYPDASPSKEFLKMQRALENPNAHRQGADRIVESEMPIPNADLPVSSGMSKQADEVRSRLPVQSMASGSYGEDQTVYVNMDQMVFATLKNRLYGLGDFIRGDLPIKPQPPVTDACSYIQFRPSARPANSLNTGAMNVMGGSFNETAVNVQELVSLDRNSSRDTMAGVIMPAPAQSATRVMRDELNQAAMMAYPETAEPSMGIGNMNDTKAFSSSYDPPDTVTFQRFV